MNYLDFIKNKKEFNNEGKIISEGLRNKDVDAGLKLILSLLKKNIDGKVIKLPGEINTIIEEQNCKTVLYIISKKYKEKYYYKVLALNFLVASTSYEVYSFSIYENLDVLTKDYTVAKVNIYPMGASIAYFLPLIYHIINTEDYNIGQYSDLSKYSANLELTTESYRQFYLGAVRYNIFEGLDVNYISGKFVDEASDELLAAKKKIYDEVKELKPNARNKPQTWKNLTADYYNIVHAIKGGAQTFDDLQFELKSDIVVKIIQDSKDAATQKELNDAKQQAKDPEQIWKQLNKYVNLVIRGINPSVIIAGAPGVGKTYRIKQQLKSANYIEGHNLWTIKGKCSPRQLSLALYNYQDRRDIILIDDADCLVGPKAPEDVVNILKAALDSTEDDDGRLVSYGITGKILDEEGHEIPKRFSYRGGIIVITNYNSGQLDTALRGRSFIQDIDFNNDEILKIIENLLPTLGGDTLSKDSKQKAFDYVKELVNTPGNDIEISIRTFSICAKLFESCLDDPDFTDEECKDMILDQLTAQALRGGKKY
jgi:hypothetical protein